MAATADQLAGALLGQALGDALGFVVEAQPPDIALAYVNEWIRTGRATERSHPQYPFGQYSDDTQLARELLRSVYECGGWEPRAFAQRLAELFRDRRDVGAGQGTRAAALRLLMGVPWSESGTPAPYAGNGSAMRAGPLGLLFSRSDSIERAAREQSRITHLDPRCAAGAVAVARAVSIAARRQQIQGDQFLQEIARAVELDAPRFAEAIRGLRGWVTLPPEAAARHVHEAGLDPAHPRWQGISAFVIPSVLWSLYAFLRSPDDYHETICTAIAVGGDTDTMAAIAGAISGARVGVEGLPRELLGHLTDQGEWGASELEGLARSCAGLAGSR
ncbi:MAG TPA: ADP-ribosylglycohydrolase family protein [Gemmatimonadales bacterium]|nr:ADP-ribosylglycohydrolase family protein [Gemmatimonadales bacterium]